MKHMQKFTAAAMAVLLLGFTVVPAFAETAPSAKEEVIYAMADASGKVTDAEAVNIFAGGDIVDYGLLRRQTPKHQRHDHPEWGSDRLFLHCR